MKSNSGSCFGHLWLFRNRSGSKRQGLFVNPHLNKSASLNVPAEIAASRSESNGATVGETRFRLIFRSSTRPDDISPAPQPTPRQPLSVNSPVLCAKPWRVDVWRQTETGLQRQHRLECLLVICCSASWDRTFIGALERPPQGRPGF